MALLPGARRTAPAPWLWPLRQPQGVNVHAQVTVPAHDTQALAHLVRYLLRPSFSLARLALRDDGAVLYRLRKPDKKGRSVLVLTPLQLLARLAPIAVVQYPAEAEPLLRLWGLFSPLPSAPEVSRQTGQVCRLLARLHAYRLAAKIPRSRRWRVSASGLRLMSATVQLREVDYPQLYRRGPVTQAA